MIANSTQWISHALISAWLLHRLTPLDGRGFFAGLWRSLLAGIVMAATVAGLDLLLGAWPLLPRIALAVTAGAAVYLAIAAALRTPALTLFTSLLLARLRRSTPPS